MTAENRVWKPNRDLRNQYLTQSSHMHALQLNGANYIRATVSDQGHACLDFTHRISVANLNKPLRARSFTFDLCLFGFVNRDNVLPIFVC